MSRPEPVYAVAGLRRSYVRGGVEVRAVDGLDLVVSAGEMVAVEGTSGSGKSSLLAMLGGLDRPTHGTVRFGGSDLGQLTDRELTALRASEIGFVFQGFNLIPTLTALQNIEAVMAPLRLPRAAQRERAGELLERVGLSSRADHLPSTLSGGEQQRVAIARALANRPRVLLADEPTGNLDSATAAQVVALLRALVDELGVTVIMVTHDDDVAAQAPRRIRMRDGRIVQDGDGSAALHLVAAPAWHPTVGRRTPLTLMPQLVASAAAVIALAGTGTAILTPAHNQHVACRVACSPLAAGQAIEVPVAPHVGRPARPTSRASSAPAARPVKHVPIIRPAATRPSPGRVVSAPVPPPRTPSVRVTTPTPPRPATPSRPKAPPTTAPISVQAPTPAPIPVTPVVPAAVTPGSGNLNWYSILLASFPQQVGAPSRGTGGFTFFPYNNG